jgi:hypothetical protein
MHLVTDTGATTSPLAPGELDLPRWTPFQPSFRRLFYVALAGNVLSKFGAFLPGMSPDDYFFAFPQVDPSFFTTFVAQGRGLSVPLVQGLAALGLSLVSIQTPALLLAMLTTSLFIAAAIHCVASSTAPRALALVAAALAATHPYLSSYFLFHMATLSLALAYAVLFLAIWALSSATLSARGKFALCTALLAIWCNSTQLVLVLFAISGMAWALARGCAALEQGRGYRAALRPALFVGGIVVSSGVLYFAISVTARQITGIYTSVEYTPHLAHGLSGLLGVEGRLAWGLVGGVGVEDIVPRGLKIALFGLVAIVLGLAVRRQARWGWAGVIVLVAGALLTVLPMAVSWGTHVPRTFSPLGMVLALSLALAGNALTAGIGRWTALLLCPFLLVFSLTSSTLFQQQSLITRWDQRTAAGVYAAAYASGLLTPERTLRLVSTWPGHGHKLSIYGSGINESALQNGWAYPGLFAVAVGESVKVDAGDPALCTGYPTWPAPGNMRLVGDRDVYVCLK